MCTIHANSAREALVKMCTLPLLAGENISARFVVPTVASSVDLVVHLGIDEHGVRRVNEIVGVPGRVENDVIETEPIFERRARRAAPGQRDAAAPRALRAGRHRRAPDPDRGALMGALVGLGVGDRAAAGLVARSSCPAAPRDERPPRAALRRLLARAGLGQVSATGFVLLCVVLRAGRRRWSLQVVSGTPPVAVAFGAMGAYLPVAVVVRAAPGAASASSPRSGRRRSTT